LDSLGSRYGPVTDAYGHCSEHSGSIKFGNFFLAAELLTSQGLCSMALVNYFVFMRKNCTSDVIIDVENTLTSTQGKLSRCTTWRCLEGGGGIAPTHS
jgi:hypothetical protein